MKKLLIIFFLFFLLSFTAGQSVNSGIFPKGGSWIQKSNYTNRYKEVVFPLLSLDIWYPIVRNSPFAFAPGAPIYDETGFINYCSDTKKMVETDIPQLFNNSKILAPCTEYFTKQPYYLNMTLNSTSPDDILKYSMNHHAVHNYCFVCEQTVRENLNRTNNLPFYDQNSCGKDACATGTCINFQDNVHLCYVWERQLFVHKEDSFHLSYLPYHYTWSKMMFFLIFSFAFFLHLSLIAIPKLHLLLVTRLKFFFTLKFQTHLFVMIGLFSRMIGMFIDLVKPGIKIEISYLTVWIGQFCIQLVIDMTIILWKHILESEMEVDHNISKFNLFLLLVMISLSSLSSVIGFFSMLLAWIFSNYAFAFQFLVILNGSVAFLDFGFFITQAVFIILFSILIFIKLVKVEKNWLFYFKTKFTMFSLLIGILNFEFAAEQLQQGLLMIVGWDYGGYNYLMVHVSTIMNIGQTLFYFLTLWGLFDFYAFFFTYKCFRDVFRIKEVDLIEFNI